ncbi:MAG: rod shape-determining protein MreC [bacterium]
MLYLNHKKKYVLFGAILLLIFFHYLGWLGYIENSLRSLLIPISSSIYNAKNKIHDQYELYKKEQEINQLYQQCQVEVESNEFLKTKIQNLEEENLGLKEMTNFKNNTNFKLITAKIVGQDTNRIEKMFIIDAGSKQGVAQGQAVIVGQGILVGKIARVEKDVSMVRTINDNQSKIAATLSNKDRSLGIVEGGYGLSIRMNLIPRDEIVMIGDKVMSSGLDKTIPRGLLIGEVTVSENEAYQPFQQAIITPATNLSKLSLVGILILDELKK